jgi:hypothetical protein
MMPRVRLRNQSEGGVPNELEQKSRMLSMQFYFSNETRTLHRTDHNYEYFRRHLSGGPTREPLIDRLDTMHQWPERKNIDVTDIIDVDISRHGIQCLSKRGYTCTYRM